MKQISNIPMYSTEDYSIFKILIGNREQNKIQTNKLVRTIREQGNITKISPITVNEKHEVIDGQHRLWAMKQIAEEFDETYPIYFFIRDGLTVDDAKKINAGSKPWSPDDYAKSYSEEGKDAYSTYLMFRDRYELNCDVLMKYLAPTDGDRNTFKNGNFFVEDEARSRAWCNRLEDMKDFYPDHKHRSFALAFLNLVSHKKYSHSRMTDQLDKYASELIRVPLKNKPMREALIEIYNRGYSDKVYFN